NRWFATPSDKSLSRPSSSCVRFLGSLPAAGASLEGRRRSLERLKLRRRVPHGPLMLAHDLRPEGVAELVLRHERLPRLLDGADHLRAGIALARDHHLAQPVRDMNRGAITGAAGDSGASASP